jgi:DNA-binding MarR family transcriptional regulator
VARGNAARKIQEASPAGAQRARKGERERTAMELDALIHERVRLAIVSALAVNQTLAFSDLKSLLDTTDGNLSVHARKLEDAGYIACTKSFNDRKPRTEFKLTAAGRRALERYLEHMDTLIQATRK